MDSIARIKKEAFEAYILTQGSDRVTHNYRTPCNVMAWERSWQETKRKDPNKFPFLKRCND